MIRTKIILIVFFLSFNLFAHSIKFSHLKADDGLTQVTVKGSNLIYLFFGDKNGALWDGGLYKHLISDNFDVLSSDFSQNINCLSSDKISSIIQYRDRNVWISTH